MKLLSIRERITRLVAIKEAQNTSWSLGISDIRVRRGRKGGFCVRTPSGKKDEHCLALLPQINTTHTER